MKETVKHLKGEKMDIIEMRVEDLIPYENNPRKNDNAVEAVANSIREFGFKVPIIVDKDNVIVAGHTRLKAAEALGLETVPVIRADDLTEEQEIGERYGRQRDGRRPARERPIESRREREHLVLAGSAKNKENRDGLLCYRGRVC